MTICEKCSWYKHDMKQLSTEQLEYQRLAEKYEGRVVHFDTRACVLGGCNGDKFEDANMARFSVGEYIIYVNGDKYELGRIKSITPDGAFVAYHEGETGAKTPFDLMHKLVNARCIEQTTLGGTCFHE